MMFSLSLSMFLTVSILGRYFLPKLIWVMALPIIIGLFWPVLTWGGYVFLCVLDVLIEFNVYVSAYHLFGTGVLMVIIYQYVAYPLIFRMVFKKIKLYSYLEKAGFSL